MITNLIAAAFLTTTLSTPSIEPVKLGKSYVKGASAKYAATISMTGMGDMRFDYTVDTKVEEVLEKGKGKVYMSAGKINSSADTASGMNPPDSKPTTFVLDAEGFPEALDTSENAFAYVFIVLGSICPNKSLNVGDPFEISWTGTKTADTISGKGSFVAMEEVEGQQAAKLTYDLRVVPKNLPTPGTLKLTNWIHPATGKVVKAEGKMALDSDGSFSMSFTVKQAK